MTVKWIFAVLIVIAYLLTSIVYVLVFNNEMSSKQIQQNHKISVQQNQEIINTLNKMYAQEKDFYEWYKANTTVTYEN